MAQNSQNWEELGRNIQQIVDSAVNRQDFRKLNQTITQTIEKAVDLGNETVRRVVQTTSGRGETGRRSGTEAEVIRKVDVSVYYGKTGGSRLGGILQILGGSLLSVITFALSLSGAALLALSGEAVMALPMGVALAGLAGGICLLGSGAGKLRRLGRFRTYCKVLGDKTHCTLAKLAQSVGKKERYVRRDVKRMIREGLFPQGHLDREETRLITSHETYAQFEQSRLQLEERQRQLAQQRQQKQEDPVSPQIREVLQKGDAFLEEIRKCNDAIPGPEISEKLFRMENIVEQIFDRVETHPQIIPDLKKMMDYYLPMAVKLLNAYVDLDSQPVQGQNILSAKQEIEQTLDTLNLAFEKLLDSLFAHAALDISSDISVLNTLLAQEGLTGDGLFRP